MNSLKPDYQLFSLFKFNPEVIFVELNISFGYSDSINDLVFILSMPIE